MDKQQPNLLFNTPERGVAFVFVAVIISAALAMLFIGLNTIAYYNTKHALQSLAKSVANYSTAGLPDIRVAVSRAEEAMSLFGDDFKNCKADACPKLEMDISFIDPEYDQGKVAGREHVRTGSYILSGPDRGSFVDANGAALGLKLPIDTITVRLYSKVKSLTGFISNTVLKDFYVSAQAEASLAPTDVVLVIDNSNSVVSPIAANPGSESLTTNHPFVTAFGRGQVATGPSQFDYGGAVVKGPSPAVAHLRQCFGKINRDLKEAAVGIFDRLSAVSSFRVGVVHTLASGSELFTPTISITKDSYEKSFVRTTGFCGPEGFYRAHYAGDSDCNQQSESYFSLTADTSQMSGIKYQDSMCGAVTSREGGGFPVPDPFFDAASAGQPSPSPDGPSLSAWSTLNFKNDLRPLLRPNNLSPGTNDPLLPLDFTDRGSLRILPRELLWLKSAGVLNFAGEPNPQYNFSQLERAIIRAMSMLSEAKARKDGRPVGRKVVILLTDGFDTFVQNGDSGLKSNDNFSGASMYIVESGFDGDKPQVKQITPIVKYLYIADYGTVPVVDNFCGVDNPVKRYTDCTIATKCSGTPPAGDEVLRPEDFKLLVFHHNEDRRSLFGAAGEGDRLYKLWSIPGHERITQVGDKFSSEQFKSCVPVPGVDLQTPYRGRKAFGAADAQDEDIRNVSENFTRYTPEVAIKEIASPEIRSLK